MNSNLLILASFILVLRINGYFAASSSKVSNQSAKPADCLEHDFQIQSMFTSTKPPFDNYYNNSRAIYPSEDISSTLVNIYVHFTNSSVDHTEFDVQEFIWSRSCLYVSDRFLSLQAMSWYSLGAIYPDRRQEGLHITLYKFCRTEDSEKKLLYFISTLEDIARSPSITDPSLNSAECVVKTDVKYKFKGWKKLLPNICWPVLLFSLFGSQVLSMVFMEFCRDAYNGDSRDVLKGKVIKAMLVLLCVLFYLGSIIAIIAIVVPALSHSTGNQLVYPVLYIVFIVFVMLRRFVYCYCIEKVIECCPCTWKLDRECGNNPPWVFLCTLYPGCFVAMHHISWIMIGIITEPFWAVPVFIAWMVVAFTIHFLALYWYIKNDKLVKDKAKWCVWNAWHFFAVFLGVLSVAPFLFALLLVGNPFFQESLIASIIPIVLFLMLGVWFKLIRNKGRSSRNNSETPSSQVQQREILNIESTV